MKITVFWDVAACCLVDIGRHFRGAYCLHHEDYLPDYTVQQPTSQPSSYSSPWQPEISQMKKDVIEGMKEGRSFKQQEFF
jgi:hypothetical protein